QHRRVRGGRHRIGEHPGADPHRTGVHLSADQPVPLRAGSRDLLAAVRVVVRAGAGDGTAGVSAGGRILGVSVEATPWTDEGRDDLSLGTRAQNADARRGRLVRGVMLAVVLLYVGTDRKSTRLNSSH